MITLNLLPPQKKDEIIKTYEPRARELAERTAAACQDLIECLAAQKDFVNEVKPLFGLGELPGKWRIPVELKPLIALPADSENNLLQKVLAKYDTDWGFLTPGGGGKSGVF